MPDINQIFSGNRLKADDLKNADGTYKKLKGAIQNVEVVQLRQDRDENSPMVNKIEISLVGWEKSIIVNKTNAGNIAMTFGNNTDNWHGKVLGVSVHQTQMGPGIKLEGLDEAPAAPPPVVSQPPQNQAATQMDQDLPVGEPGFQSDDPFDDGIPFS